MLGGYSRVISAQSWRFVPADVGLHRGSDRKRFSDCLLPVWRTTLTRILMSDRKFRIGITTLGRVPSVDIRKLQFFKREAQLDWFLVSTQGRIHSGVTQVRS